MTRARLNLAFWLSRGVAFRFDTIPYDDDDDDGEAMTRG